MEKQGVVAPGITPPSCPSGKCGSKKASSQDLAERLRDLSDHTTKRAAEAVKEVIEESAQ